MADRTVTCSYTGVASSDIVRWSANVQVGVTPGRATLRLKNPGGQSAANFGTLTFSDGVGTVSLPDCAVVERVVEENGRYLRLVLEDRRWRWREGHIDGWYNETREDDTLAREKTPQELATLLLDAMGETGYSVAGLPAEPRPEVDWVAANPAVELAALCQQLSCSIALATDGTIAIVEEGSGAAIPTADLKHADAAGARRPSPDSIRVACGPTKFQVTFDLEPVGIEPDGEIKTLPNLSYAPNSLDATGGFNTQGDAFEALKGTTNDANGNPIKDRDLARRSVWRMYRVSGVVSGSGANSLNPQGWADLGLPDIESIDQLLPIENSLNEFETVGNQKVRLDARVIGDFVRDDGELKTLVSGERYRGSVGMDGERGIVIFGEPMYGGSVGGPRVAASITLECICEISHPSLGNKVYYAKTRALSNPNGPSIATRVRDELEQRVIAKPGENPDSENNTSALDTKLDFYLDQMAAEYTATNSGTATYHGFKVVALDGVIKSIAWSGSSAAVPRTTIGVNTRANRRAPDYETAQKEAARSVEDRHERRRRLRRERVQRQRQNRHARYDRGA